MAMIYPETVVTKEYYCTLLVIESYISFHNELICLEIALFDISSKGKRGSLKDQAFVYLFAIAKEAEPLR